MSERVEVEAEVPVEQMGLPSTITPQTLSRIGEIIDAISHEDAIKIFIYAKDGITNSTLAIKKLGLTQKRYYTRLRQLVKVGVLEKGDEGYRYTFLGNIVYQMGKSFRTVIEQGDRLELANKLRKTETLSLEEKKNLMGLIAPTESGDFSSLADLISPVRMVDNYEDLVKNLVDLIEQTDESIYLVSRYHDVRVIEAMMRAYQRGVEMRALGRKSGMFDRINMLRTLLSPKMLGLLIKGLKELSDTVRNTEISYTFIILDKKWVFIEVPHPTKDVFYLGFIFQNKEICSRLSIIFNDMWEKAEKTSFL